MTKKKTKVTAKGTITKGKMTGTLTVEGEDGTEQEINIEEAAGNELDAIVEEAVEVIDAEKKKKLQYEKGAELFSE